MKSKLLSGSIPLKLNGVAVYRAYDWRDNLLYVGISSQVCQRMAGHAAKSDWWQKAARVDWAEFPDRRAAETEERRLIRRHDPPYNTAHRPRFYVVLTANDRHEDGCPEGAFLAAKAMQRADRF
jgi:excinuclease UvrABC nuclease subunit